MFEGGIGRFCVLLRLRFRALFDFVRLRFRALLK